MNIDLSKSDRGVRTDDRRDQLIRKAVIAGCIEMADVMLEINRDFGG